MELHPLCTLFPRMEGSDFGALVSDIKANGLRQPIIVHDDMILDGGNRFRACKEAGIQPYFEIFEGDSPVSFVLSANLHRRHMTAGQQAAIVAAAVDWGKAHKHGGDRKSDQAGLVPLDTIEKRAATSGANEKTQRKAETLTREHPAVATEVRQGKKSLYRAVQETSPAKPSAAAKPPSDVDRLRDQIADLKTQLAEALENAEDLRRELSDLLAIQDGEEAKRVAALRADLKAASVVRDQYMRENSQLKRQCKSYERQLGIAKKAA